MMFKQQYKDINIITCLPNDRKPSLDRLVSDFKNFYEAKVGTDFVIEFVATSTDPVSVTAIPCHKEILSARWSWFRRMISSNMKEAITGAELLLSFLP